MQHPMQAQMGAYPHNVTTELIQKYLDENKQLILAILDNQNLGKLNECAVYQARLQANLMYLAAIADSQPQPPPVYATQVPPSATMQPGMQYMANQQAQQQMAQQSLLAARNALQYSQHPYPSLHQVPQRQQQPAMHEHQGMNANAAGANPVNGLVSESGMGNMSLSSGGLFDHGRGGNVGDANTGRVFSGGTKSDLVSANDGGVSTPGGVSGGAGHAAEESETSFLKGSEEEGN